MARGLQKRRPENGSGIGIGDAVKTADVNLNPFPAIEGKILQKRGVFIINPLLGSDGDDCEKSLENSLCLNPVSFLERFLKCRHHEGLFSLENKGRLIEIELVRAADSIADENIRLKTVSLI